MLKCAPGVWRKRELYIIEKSLIVFEKKKIMLKTWRLAPGYPMLDRFLSFGKLTEFQFTNREINVPVYQ